MRNILFYKDKWLYKKFDFLDNLSPNCSIWKHMLCFDVELQDSDGSKQHFATFTFEMISLMIVAMNKYFLF